MQLQARMKSSHANSALQVQFQQNRARLPKPMIALDKASRQAFQLLPLHLRGQRSLALLCGRFRPVVGTGLASLLATAGQTRPIADRRLHGTGKVSCTLVYFYQPKHPRCTTAQGNERYRDQIPCSEKNGAWLDVLCPEELYLRSIAARRSQAESSPYFGLIYQGIIGASIHIIAVWWRTLIHFF